MAKKAPGYVKYYNTQDKRWTIKYERPPVYIDGHPVDLNYMTSAQANYILGRCGRCGRSTRCLPQCKELGLIPIEDLPTRQNKYKWNLGILDNEKNKKLADDIFHLTKPFQADKEAVEAREQWESSFLSDLGGKIGEVKSQ